MTIWDALQNPPVNYRPVPLWSWNDLLEKEELERQMEEMHRVGIGGFFMHARGGLKTPYMSEAWLEAIQVCIAKSKELGMEAWFYDENGWPSGFGNGNVPALGLAYQQKRIAYEKAPFGDDMGSTIAMYVKTEKGYRLLTNGEESNADLRLYYEVNPYYIDTLSKHAVQAFIESTYVVYWEHFGKQFGAHLQGIFTDEPQFARGQLPWSFELEEVFQTRYGYELKAALPALFFEIEDCRKSRYDFWECVTTMFTEAYAKQIGDWCEQKGWSATGHVVDEQTLMQQVTSVGDPMAFYEYLQIPGCDWLGRFISEEPLVPKQVSSVTHQLGKKQAITESFGCSGWNVSMQELKRIGEWQFVHGINLMCQHLQSYTLKGLRKRDYPPSLFYQQPWWKDYKMFNDYFGRLSMLLAEGKRQAEVLLLHPIRTAWVEQVDQDQLAIVPYHESFALLSRWMCQQLLEHDYGSESIMERHARVEGNRLIIGEAVYSVVIIPPCLTLNRVTVELLKQFVQQGGTLIAFSPMPTLINGERHKDIDQLVHAAVQPEWSSDALLRAVSNTVSPFIWVYDSYGKPITADTLNVQTLKLEGAYLHYLVHSGDERYNKIYVDFRESGAVSLIDLETGSIIPIEHQKTEKGVRVSLILKPGQSYMLKLEPCELASAVNISIESEVLIQKAPLLSDTNTTLALDKPWTILHSDLNSLTLDTCRLRIEDGEWSEIQPVIFIQEQLLAIGRPVHIELQFEFHVAFNIDVSREMYIVMEQLEEVEIIMNERIVELTSSGWWIDTSFHKVNISEQVIQGTNKIHIKSYFYNTAETYESLERAHKFESEGNKLTFDSEIESIYIVGAFGVKSQASYVECERNAIRTDGPFIVTEQPISLQSGDFVRQGFPFFAGKLQLEQRVIIDREDWNGARWLFTAPPNAIISQLRINNKEVRIFMWEPYEADITSYLCIGDNLIELELTGSCRNLLGPHHHIKGEVYKVGPDSFKDKPGWTDKDLDPNTRLYQNHYTFVQFGLHAVPSIELT